ncbi:hypothetical protein [Nostoc sp. UHCC 0302]
MQIDIDEQALTIYIEDTGATFDPLQELSVQEELIHKASNLTMTS